jgi:hypothetical protein
MTRVILKVTEYLLVCHHRRLNCLVNPTPMTLCLLALAGKSFASYFVLCLDVAAWRAVAWEARGVFGYSIDLERVYREGRN